MNKKNKKKFNVSLITLGCKVNQFDSESIYAQLQKYNNRECEGFEPIDICIVNTCTVTGKASMQSRQAIRKAIRKNPQAIVIATGCYAQSEPQELKKIKGLDYIIGNSDKHRIAQILLDSKEKQNYSSPVMIYQDIRNKKNISQTIVPLIANRTRPFIKIQDGCDHFCTYCIVPYTRGPSRSLLPEAVFNIINNLPILKRKEIVLTGIHLGKYGMDLTPASSLLTLLKQFDKTNIVNRIRLSSIESVELTDDLLNFIAKSNRICHHFHIPMQSGDKHILKIMNRPYNPEQFENLIKKINHMFPEAAIGIDIMVGFPGETENAFMNTYRLIESLPITYLHVFPFSSRPGTKASSFPDHVDPRTIKQRRNKLLNLGYRKKKNFYTHMIGKTLNVLIEEKRKFPSGHLTGVSDNYVRVQIDGDDRLKNKIIPCRINRILNKNAVWGEHMT